MAQLRGEVLTPPGKPGRRSLDAILRQLALFFKSLTSVLRLEATPSHVSILVAFILDRSRHLLGQQAFVRQEEVARNYVGEVK